ncbi:unnamed protein product [Vitrella brassicaformis CCMP3155]|uniref:Uncharacterized protein n=1 Tax=Vitrella brassicaformis (strain CCMP3155) TaxID=1169540 RepID=A0A0G4G0M3_VITBC|nr:unnamed protein product [Vitrella brassicaformis CCMP3155]|eukprot:CEM21088.1 unnamed protein product [Vitrella brassicaformis CCMP3155]
MAALNSSVELKSIPLRSTTAVVLLFVTAALQTSSRQVSSFSSPLSLPNHLFRPSGAMQSHRHSYTTSRGLGEGSAGFPKGDETEPPTTLCPFSYQQKIIRTFEETPDSGGMIDYFVEAGYEPVIPGGLSSPSKTRRLHGVALPEEEWADLPVAMEGNYTCWRKLLNESLIPTGHVVKEPPEEGDHFIILFGRWIHTACGFVPPMLEELWTDGVLKGGVDQMKQLGGVLQRGDDGQKDVIYVFLVDGPKCWFDMWAAGPGSTASKQILDYLAGEGVSMFHGHLESQILEREDGTVRHYDKWIIIKRELEQVREENERLRMELANGGVGEEMVTG